MTKGYLARRLESQAFRQAFDEERARIDAIDRIVRALDDARRERGLSKAELARRTDKHGEFVRRLFTTQQPNPTLETVVTIAAALDLDVTLTPRAAEQDDRRGARPQLADLADAWERTPYGDVPDWTRFRAFLDELRLQPSGGVTAVRKRPAPTGSAVIDTLLAGIAERIADDAGKPRPVWTRDVPALEAEWSVPGTSAMLARRRRTTPRQLRERGLVLDEASLWRSLDV